MKIDFFGTTRPEFEKNVGMFPRQPSTKYILLQWKIKPFLCIS